MLIDPLVLKRIGDAFNFRQPDRVPIWESLQNQAVYDYCAPRVPFPECAAIACEKLGIDATYGCMEAVSDERAKGSVVHAAQTPWQTASVFRSLNDLRRCKAPKVRESELEERLLAEHHAAQELYGPRVIYLPQNGGWGFLPGYEG